MSPLCQNIAGPIKSLPILWSPPEVSPSADNLPVKNLSRPGGRRAGRIFAGKLSAGGDFSGGDPIMEQRRFQPARTCMEPTNDRPPSGDT